MLNGKEKEEQEGSLCSGCTYIPNKVSLYFLGKGNWIDVLGPSGEVIILEKWGMLAFPLNQSDLESLWGKQMWELCKSQQSHTNYPQEIFTQRYFFLP